MTKPEMQLIIERNKNKTLNCADIFSHDNIFHYPSNLTFVFFCFCFCLQLTYSSSIHFVTIKIWGDFCFVLSIIKSEKRAEMLTYTTEPSRPDLYTCLSASGINANISLTLQIKVSRTLYTNRIH